MQPNDADTKSGRKVLEVLREKHPPMRDPDLNKPDPACFENYPSIPALLPQIITSEVVEDVLPRLSGGAGPGGTDAIALGNWSLCFGAESEQLHEELAAFGEWLANCHPRGLPSKPLWLQGWRPWISYRASARLASERSSAASGPNAI